MIVATLLAGLARGRLLSSLLLAAVCLLAPSSSTPAQNPHDGQFITVPNPIRDDVVQQIKLKIADILERQKRTLETVVFDFNPEGQPASSGSFGSCSDLADFIRNLQLGVAHPEIGRIKAVAFVHGPVSQHSVLPVLACGQIVMSEERDDEGRVKARIGSVGRGNEPLSKTMRDTYRHLAEQYPSPDLIGRMLDANLPLRRVRTGQAVYYLTPARVETWKSENKVFVVESEVPAGLEIGSTSLDAVRARELGLASAFYDTRAAVAEAFGLPSQSLVEDWLVGKTKSVWRIDVTGPLTKASIDSLRRRISAALGRGANFLILNLDSEGGETTHVAPLADELRNLKVKDGSYAVKKVAFIPKDRALGAACFLAVACDEIVMGAGSALADFNYLAGDSDETMRVRRDMLIPLLKERNYPVPLFDAALTRGLVLARVRSAGALPRLVTEAQLKENQDAHGSRWDVLGRIAPAAGETFVRVDADLAREWRIARETGIDTPEALYAYYGLDAEHAPVRVSRDDMLDRVAEFFREPLVNFVLIMLGIAGLILELKLPGTTFPGAIAAICFVLFFWAYSFVGEFTLLAVLLFILGLILIGVEIFLVPGLGFSGIAGVVLVVTSLTLVTLEHWPQTSADWVHLGSTVSLLATSLVTAVAFAFLFAWFLPSIPYLNRLVLQPPADDHDIAADHSSACGYVSPALLGAIGVAVTTLRPSGKAQFNEEFLDVIAEGDYVVTGSRVQVIEIEGNRIVVKEV